MIVYRVAPVNGLSGKNTIFELLFEKSNFPATEGTIEKARRVAAVSISQLKTNSIFVAQLILSMILFSGI